MASLLAISAAVAACSTLRTEVVIRARPERVWDILTDLERYPQWNPFFVRAKGKLVPDQNLELVMLPVGKSEQAFSPKVLEVAPRQRLVWRGRLLMPLLFDGTHHFTIEVVSDHCVRFVQYEDFSGILVPFVGFEPYRQGWLRMNQALKRRAEAPP